MRVTFYPEKDALYVQLLDEKVSGGQDLDDNRHLDFAEAGGVVGIEFLGVSSGVDLADIPGINEQTIASLLEVFNLKVLA